MRLNASDKAGSYKYDLKKLHSNRSALVSIIYCELICTTLILVYALLTHQYNPGGESRLEMSILKGREPMATIGVSQKISSCPE